MVTYNDGYRDGYLYGLTALKLRIEYWQKIQDGCADDYGVSSQLQLLLRDVRELESWRMLIKKAGVQNLNLVV